MDKNTMQEVIEFIPKKDKLSKGIKEASGEIKELKKEASNIELTPTNEKVRKASKEALENKKSQNIEQKRAVEITRELNDLMRQASGSEEKRKAEVKAWRKEVAKLEAEYTKISMSGGDTSKISEELSRAYKELNKALDGSKITGFQKLLNTFKRVGFYRLARRLFQLIEQGLAKGLQGLVEFDSQTNKTMSSISSSVDKINSSIAMLIMPLIEISEPVILSIANAMSNFANNISLASSYMKGLSEYTKINEEYMKDLQSEAKSTLTSFDSFEALNSSGSPFEKAKITEEDKEIAEQYGDTIKRIQDIFSKIWEVVKALGGALLHIFKQLEPYWDDIFDGILFLIDVLADVVVFLSKAFAWIMKLVDTKPKLMALVTALTIVASLIQFAMGNPIKGILTAVMGIVSLTAIAVPEFANGGIAEKGDLFVANEKGPELVYSGPNNSSSIMNISQFKQAMVEAIYECADVFQQPDGGVALYLDGAQIARSKSFKNELNRTNAGLNLR